MKAKKKNAIFICQITESSFKVIKCLIHNSVREFTDLEFEAVEKINQVFKKLEYNNNPVIVALARNQVTCRYIKVPTQAPEEIEKIVALQASQYLPYPANELITGYQTISVDKDGYAHLNLIIVHKDAIERYLKIFKELKVPKLSIVLSSYGLCNFYNRIKPEDAGPIMLMDIDAGNVEVAIAADKKLLFSRYFKLNKSQANWESLFIDEIKKTQDLYSKEVSAEAPQKRVIVGAGQSTQGLREVLIKQGGLSSEVLSYQDKINLSENLLKTILNADNSFISLFGLALQDVEESLNLLPLALKEETKRLSKTKEHLRAILFILGMIVIWGIAIGKNLDNKARYLERLKTELSKISKEAQPLEQIEKRMRLLDSRTTKRPTAIDLLYELYQVMPNEVTLVSFSYEEDKQVILRGQAGDLNSVFVFVGHLEKSKVFKNFQSKVRYATKKKTQAGEVVDFEITCLKSV